MINSFVLSLLLSFIRPAFSHLSFCTSIPCSHSSEIDPCIIHPCTHRLMHLFIYGMIHPCGYSSMESCTHAVTHPWSHPPMQSPIHGVIHPCSHPSMESCTHTVTHPWSHPPMQSSIHGVIHPYSQSSMLYLCSSELGIADCEKRSGEYRIYCICYTLLLTITN